jgi:hypothetical protein
MGVLGECVDRVPIECGRPYRGPVRPLILASTKRILRDHNGSLAGAQVARRPLTASPTQTKHLSGGVARHLFALKTLAARNRPYPLRYNSEAEVHIDMTHSTA